MLNMYPFFDLLHQISYLWESYDRKRFFQHPWYFTSALHKYTLVLYSMSYSKRATHEYPSFYNPGASTNYLQKTRTLHP